MEVEYTFIRARSLFYFTADGRVFQELVKTWLRCSAPALNCGRSACGMRLKYAWATGVAAAVRCAAPPLFWDDLHRSPSACAKDQGLSLNPSKISGNCGPAGCAA